MFKDAIAVDSFSLSISSIIVILELSILVVKLSIPTAIYPLMEILVSIISRLEAIIPTQLSGPSVSWLHLKP